MNIFSEICSGKEYKDNYFFQEWHKAIIRDFETFKTILSSYHESSAKKLLVEILYLSQLLEFTLEDLTNETKRKSQIIQKRLKSNY